MITVIHLKHFVSLHKLICVSTELTSMKSKGCMDGQSKSLQTRVAYV